MTGNQLVRPVILCGGSGTRLWPLSDENMPKQFLALTGESTMLQLTAQRVLGVPDYAPPIIVTNSRHGDEVERQIRGTGADDISLILEPFGRNTASAIALAALRSRPDEILLVMPSDHVIKDVEKFRAAVGAALPLAQGGHLVTFGITPTAAETGYGYIRRGNELVAHVYHALEFVEKPGSEAAQRYVSSGDYSWNAGIFLFRADDFLAALSRHASAVGEACREAVANGQSRGSSFLPEPTAFARSPSVSVDYAVMEKADRVAVATADIGWSDIGSWDALYEFLPRRGPNEANNPEFVQLDSSGCLLKSDGPLIATIGVEDLIVVATRDAVLVVRRGESQRVKEVVEEFKRRRQ